MHKVTRFRAPHKVHILSWTLALEKEGTVACHFKDCQFMALSIEEMGNHYPYCSCENIKYPFICHVCDRRTDALEKLLLHRIYSHSYEPTDEESRILKEYRRNSLTNEITPILKRSWEIFLEKKKYLKCLRRECLYVSNSLEDMMEHYTNLCDESLWKKLNFQCEFCNGRVLSDHNLLSHITDAHESKTYLVNNIVTPEYNYNCVEIWSNDILEYKQAKCLVEGCKFVDNNVKILEKHYAICNGLKKNFEVCKICGSWLLNQSRLNEHKRCIHKDVDETLYDSENASENHSNLVFDGMCPGQGDTLEIKVDNIMDSIDIPSCKIPVLYLCPSYDGPVDEENRNLKDPLA